MLCLGLCDILMVKIHLCAILGFEFISSDGLVVQLFIFFVGVRDDKFFIPASIRHITDRIFLTVIVLHAEITLHLDALNKFELSHIRSYRGKTDHIRGDRTDDQQHQEDHFHDPQLPVRFNVLLKKTNHNLFPP